MLEQTIGRIKVYRENGVKTVKVLMFEVEFDPTEPEKITHQLMQNSDSGIFLELDIYYPSKRRIDMLERDSQRLHDVIDDLRETIESLEDVD